jgi:hypothetical protein
MTGKPQDKVALAVEIVDNRAMLSLQSEDAGKLGILLRPEDVRHLISKLAVTLSQDQRRGLARALMDPTV